jgi:hypothetical protein
MNSFIYCIESADVGRTQKVFFIYRAGQTDGQKVEYSSEKSNIQSNNKIEYSQADFLKIRMQDVHLDL